MNPDETNRPEPLRARRCRNHLGTGIFLILLGLLLALDQWQHAPFHHLGRYWPLILIALGLGRMVDRGLFAVGPHMTILVGLFFELRALGHGYWIERVWPLGIVWLGLILILRGLRPRATTACGWPHD